MSVYSPYPAGIPYAPSLYLFHFAKECTTSAFWEFIASIVNVTACSTPLRSSLRPVPERRNSGAVTRRRLSSWASVDWNASLIILMATSVVSGRSLRRYFCGIISGIFYESLVDDGIYNKILFFLMMLQSYFAGIKYASKMIKIFYICC